MEESSTSKRARNGEQTAVASEGPGEVSDDRLHCEDGEEQPLWEGVAASEEVDIYEEESLGGGDCQQTLQDDCPRTGQASIPDEDERQQHLRDCTEHLRRCAEHLRGCMEAVDAAHAEDAAGECIVSKNQATEANQDEGQSCLASWRELGWETHSSVEPGRGQYWFNWVTGERWWQQPVTAVPVLLVQPTTAGTGERRSRRNKKQRV